VFERSRATRFDVVGAKVADRRIGEDGRRSEHPGRRQRVLVFSTRVFVPNQINKSWTMMIRSEDDVATLVKTGDPDPANTSRANSTTASSFATARTCLGSPGTNGLRWGCRHGTEGEMDLTAGVMLSKDTAR
jgi:hypothetical protein